jgi:hypothetical protein
MEPKIQDSMYEVDLMIMSQLYQYKTMAKLLLVERLLLININQQIE